MVWNVGQLPFVYSPQKEPTNDDLPDMLPFSLTVDPKLGHIIQRYDPLVEETLKKAYEKGSLISGIGEDQGIGRKYVEDALSFVRKYIGQTLDGRSVLDIGCGTGFFLSLLKEMGADVMGIEPGIHGQAGSQRFGVPVVRDFFPSSKVSRSFDIITAFFVLEHLRDVQNFLMNIREHLKNDGILFLSVPDCEPYLAHGDISFLFHEHWNYFTEQSLYAVLTQILGVKVVIEKSGFGGSLYAFAQLGSSMSSDHDFDISVVHHQYMKFQSQAIDNTEAITNLIVDIINNGKTIGIFVPARSVNFLALNIQRIDLRHIRFFDDDKMLHNTFFPGIPIKVESRNELLVNPPDCLLIMSNTFGNVIAESLIKSGFTQPIQVWEDIFSTNNKFVTSNQ